MNIFKKFSWPAWIMIAASALLSCFFVYTISDQIRPTPVYNDFCKENKLSAPANNFEDCKTASGLWVPANPPTKDYRGYCDVTSKCNGEYETARKVHGGFEYSFVSIVALIFLLIGLFAIRKFALISYAAVISGLFILIVNHIAHWEVLGTMAKPIVLLISIGLVVYAMKQYEQAEKQ